MKPITPYSLLTENFDEPVLYEPARIENGYNVLKIITAFTDCERISRHLIGLSDGIKETKYVKGMSVDIIVGMTKSSLSRRKHEAICRLMNQLNGNRDMPKINCYYINSGQEVHTKMYIWGKGDRTSATVYGIAYCGSLNYTMNAFYKRRESVSLCNPLQAYSYYEELFRDSINCLEPAAVARVRGNTPESKDDECFENETDYDTYNGMPPVDTLQVSLLKANGDVGYGSGVNWGIRKNGTRRNRDQAYIPYNVACRKDGFFPGRINAEDENCPIFRVITSDFGSFHMRLAQQGDKALHTAESNAILGEWLRKRLRVNSGEFISKEMLESYGKTYVTFRKYKDGTYLLDF